MILDALHCPHRSCMNAFAVSPAVIETLGFVAAICTTLAWVPQALKTIRSRDTRSISLWMQSLMTLGIFLWLVYGVLIVAWPLIGANIVTLGLVATILVLKIRYG
jgi:MtN3 and saliva related transmembrane protein